MILSEFKKTLKSQKRGHSYRVLSWKYRVNRRYLWEILNTPEYKPPQWVMDILGVEIKKRPHRIAVYTELEHIDKTVETLKKHLSPEAIDKLKDAL